MVSVAQLVRASDCGSEGRGFEPHFSPKNLIVAKLRYANPVQKLDACPVNRVRVVS